MASNHSIASNDFQFQRDMMMEMTDKSERINLQTDQQPFFSEEVMLHPCVSYIVLVVDLSSLPA